MKTGQEAVKVIRAVVFGCVTVAQFGKHCDYIESEMAGEVLSALPATVSQIVDQQMPRGFDGAARENQRLALDACGSSAAVHVLDTAHPAATLVHNNARHR